MRSYLNTHFVFERWKMVMVQLQQEEDSSLVAPLSPFHQALKTAYISIKGDFLLPQEYHNIGHEHQWVVLDADFCICRLCGWNHVCFKGKCPVVQMEHSEHVCSISGCVVLKSEMKPEWGSASTTTITMANNGHDCDDASSSTSMMMLDSQKCCTSSGSYHNILSNGNGKKSKNNLNKGNQYDGYTSDPPPPNRISSSSCSISSSGSKKGLGKKKRAAGAMLTSSSSTINHNNNSSNTRKKMMRRSFPAATSAMTMMMDHGWRHPKKIMKGSMEVHEFVEIVVREILDSQKTLRCREEEIVRDKTRKVACLAKILRETTTSVSNDSAVHQQQSPVLLLHPGGGGGSFISTFMSAHCSTALVCQRPNMIEIEAKLSWMCRFFIILNIFIIMIVLNLKKQAFDMVVAGSADTILTTTPPTIMMIHPILRKVRIHRVNPTLRITVLLLLVVEKINLKVLLLVRCIQANLSHR